MTRHGSRLIAVTCIAAAFAGCSGGGDGSEADSLATFASAETSATVPVSPPATEPAATDPPTTTSTSTTTTLPAAWHRDTEMAVRACLDDAMLGEEKVGFMNDFDDDVLVREVIDLCDEAQSQLGVEEGLPAASMALEVSEINMTLNYAVLMWLSDEQVDAGNVADLEGMFAKAFQAKSLIPV